MGDFWSPTFASFAVFFTNFLIFMWEISKKDLVGSIHNNFYGSSYLHINLKLDNASKDEKLLDTTWIGYRITSLNFYYANFEKEANISKNKRVLKASCMYLGGVHNML